jgi:hypothetical protein
VPLTAQSLSPERAEATERVKASLRKLVRDYNASQGRTVLACSGCVTLIAPGAAFALHFNPIRMVGEVHCLRCYEESSPVSQERYIIVKEIAHAANDHQG